MRLSTLRLFLSVTFLLTAFGIICHAQDIKILAKNLKFNHHTSIYDTKLQFTPNGNQLVFQHKDSDYDFISLLFDNNGNAVADTSILSTPNLLLHTDEKLKMMLTRVPHKTLSPGHYYRGFTAVFNEKGKQVDSIPVIFNTACFIGKTQVFGATTDSLYVFEMGKGIIIRKPHATKDYTYHEKPVYQAGRIYQSCMKSDYSSDVRTIWLRIINPVDLSEKMVQLPGKYDGLTAEAMPSGDIWLMGNGEFETKKSYLLCYNPKAGKVTWKHEINAYTTDWGLAKNDGKLFTGTGIGFVTDSTGTVILNSVVSGTSNSIVSRLGVQPQTGRIALFYYGKTDNSELVIYNMRSGKIEHQLQFENTSIFAQKVKGIAWHPVKKMLAFYVEHDDYTVSLGTISFPDNAIANTPQTAAKTAIKAPGIVLQDAHNFKPTAIAFSNNGSWMVSGDLSGRVNVWDAKSKLIYNKVFLGGSGENKFRSDNSLPLAIHPTQKMFAVSFVENYVFLMDFDGNYLDKITINRYSRLLHFSDDGQYLIMSDFDNSGLLTKYNIKTKSIENTYRNVHMAVETVVPGNFYRDSRYYYNPQAGALVKLNLLNGEVEKNIPFKTDKKVALFDVTPDETAAMLLTDYLELFHIDLTTGKATRLNEPSSHPMGTYQPGFNGQQTIEVPRFNFIKFDNNSIIISIEYHRQGDIGTKYYGIITAPFNKANLRMGKLTPYQQPLITAAPASKQLQPGTDYLWVGNDDGSLHTWDLRLDKQAAVFGGNTTYPALLDANKLFDGVTLSMSPEEGQTNTGWGQNFIRFDFGNAEVLSLERNGAAPNFIHTANNKNLISQELSNLLTIDMQSKKERIDTAFFYENKLEYISGHLLYVRGSSMLYYNATDQTLRWFDNAKQVKSVTFPADMPLKGKHRFEMDNWSFNSDSTKLYAKFTYNQFDDKGYYQTEIIPAYYSYDIKTGASTRLEVPKQLIQKVKDYFIWADNVLYTDNNLLYRYNLSTAKIDSASMLKPISGFAASYGDQGIFSNGRYAVTMYHLDTVRSFNQQYIHASILNMQNFKAIADFQLKYSKVESFAISRDNRLLFVHYHNEVEIRDITSGKLIATLAILPGNKFIIYTPDNYYYASQKLTEMAFRTKGKVYGVEQFDLKYNRPDIVLKRLGYAPANLIDIYKKAYLKRLQRLNFTEERVNDETEPPAIELVNRLQIPAKTSAGTVSLKLKCATPGSVPDRISISVNDVPVFGIKGYKVTDVKGTEYTAELPITLMNGQNRIKYSVYNAKGAKSLSENIDVVYEPATPAKPKVYFAGIGVSNYKDSRMNLKYADKDIRDIATEIKAKFAGSDVITLLNADATVANIRQLKQKFMQTNVDDIIILYISGHGLLNTSADFFYATYETNFTAPDLTALPYKDIEGLLDGVPARKKLVMIDACHSGEADKTDKTLTAGLAANVKPTLAPGAKGFGNKTPSKQQTGLQNSFMLMQNLFVDLNEGSGAVVISAAAGDSFALESPKWNNGIFTYSVIKALKDNEADYNKDEKINLSELRKYVYETVSKETGGKQQPTTREENLGFDWQVW